MSPYRAHIVHILTIGILLYTLWVLLVLFT